MGAASKLAAGHTALGEWLAARIRAGGPITFAEYMGECLYHPAHGYYSRSEARRFADYYTSVDVNPVFGRLLARQLAEMWAGLGRPREFSVIECGAGTARLAEHILGFVARALPDFYAALRYVAVEPSRERSAACCARLAHYMNAGHAEVRAGLPERIAVGCILSNELLDALPVHRVVCEGGDLREVYVALDGACFADHVGPLSTPRIGDYFAEQGITLREGQHAEAGLAAADWMAQAGRALERGFVVTIDNGHEARELYNERHMRGTLLAYHQHRATEDWYARPGEQDLTAHVNFTALDLAGARAGLSRTGLTTQTNFLLALGRGNEFADLYDDGMSEAERVRARLGLKSLIHPEGMGETFRVLIQHKGVEAPGLTGLQPL